jgi:hypothetical protein
MSSVVPLLFTELAGVLLRELGYTYRSVRIVLQQLRRSNGDVCLWQKITAAGLTVRVRPPAGGGSLQGTHSLLFNHSLPEGKATGT